MNKNSVIHGKNCSWNTLMVHWIAAMLAETVSLCMERCKIAVDMAGTVSGCIVRAIDMTDTADLADTADAADMESDKTDLADMESD